MVRTIKATEAREMTEKKNSVYEKVLNEIMRGIERKSIEGSVYYLWPESDYSYYERDKIAKSQDFVKVKNTLENLGYNVFLNTTNANSINEENKITSVEINWNLSGKRCTSDYVTLNPPDYSKTGSIGTIKVSSGTGGPVTWIDTTTIPSWVYTITATGTDIKDGYYYTKDSECSISCDGQWYTIGEK